MTPEEMSFELLADKLEEIAGHADWPYELGNEDVDALREAAQRLRAAVISRENQPRQHKESKMYMLFVGEDYYPIGGAKDFRGVFATVEEAQKAFDDERFKGDWAHVATLRDGNLEVIAEYERRAGVREWRNLD